METLDLQRDLEHTPFCFQESNVHFEHDGQPPEQRSWTQRALLWFFGRPRPGKWVDTPRAHTSSRTLVGRYGLLFEAHRPLELYYKTRPQTSPNPVGSFQEGLAQTALTRFRASGDSPSREEENHGRTTTASAISRFTQLLDALKALVRMLRTCHVVAVLTKRLVFGAILGVSRSHVASEGPGSARLTTLLMTSLVYFLWVILGKPYVSRAMQGVESLMGLLEVLTLSLAVLSGRAELKASKTWGGRSGVGGGFSSGSWEGMQALSNGMLGLQLGVMAVGIAYQWWAAGMELKNWWAVWARHKNRHGRGVDLNVEGGLDGDRRRWRKKRGVEMKGIGEAKSLKVGSKQHGLRASGNGLGQRRKAKVLTSPPPHPARMGLDETESGYGLLDSRDRGLTRRLPRARKQVKGSLANQGTRSEAAIERFLNDLVRAPAGLEWGLDANDSEGPSNRSGEFDGAKERPWKRERRKKPGGGLAASSRSEERRETKNTQKHARRIVKDGGEKIDRESQLQHRSNRTVELPNNLRERALMEGDPLDRAAVMEKRVARKKLMRLVSQRQERGTSSLTTFRVSETDTSEEEGGSALEQSAELTMQVMVRHTVVASFTFKSGPHSS
jgi:hypothetical protein